jgi:DEAD/DEAH box helicase domain-containing protein
LYNPPLLNAQLGIRRGVVHSARAIAERLGKEGAQSIVFARSRHEVELLTQYLRDAGPSTPQAREAVRGYRSGYLPRERRAIEAGLRSGEVRTVVSTNALELGIDIGGMQAAVLAGYPGTLASLWQQLGRAGRSSEVSLGVVVASGDPLGQYVVTHTDYLFGQPVESALITDNLSSRRSTKWRLRGYRSPRAITHRGRTHTAARCPRRTGCSSGRATASTGRARLPPRIRLRLPPSRTS